MSVAARIAERIESYKNDMHLLLNEFYHTRPEEVLVETVIDHAVNGMRVIRNHVETLTVIQAVDKLFSLPKDGKKEDGKVVKKRFFTFRVPHDEHRHVFFGQPTEWNNFLDQNADLLTETEEATHEPEQRFRFSYSIRGGLDITYPYDGTLAEYMTHARKANACLRDAYFI